MTTNATTKPFSLIPAGYTYFSLDTLITTRARDMAQDLLEQAGNRNPDAFDMYVYNDYYAYGVMDLIDKTMTTLHTKLTKKAWDDAFVTLEALSILNEVESVWTTCDAGEQVEITIKAYGACIVTLLEKLEGVGRLNVEHYASLEHLLRNLALWGKGFEWIGASDFHRVCCAVGRKLFKGRTQADQELERARLEEWLDTLDPEDRNAMTKQLEKRDKEEAQEKAEGKPQQQWYDEGLGDEIFSWRARDYHFTKTWKDYKTYLKESPNFPFRGPPVWDLTEWSEDEKKPYLYGALDGDDDI